MDESKNNGLPEQQEPLAAPEAQPPAPEGASAPQGSVILEKAPENGGSAENGNPVDTEGTAGAGDAPAQESGVSLEKAAPSAVVPQSPESGSALQGSPAAASGGWQPESGGEAVVKSHKGMIGLVALIGALLIAIVVLVTVGIATRQSPEDAVHEAIEKTNELLQAKSSQMMEELPAMRVMYQPITGSRSTDFDLSFVSFDDGSGSLQAQFYSNLLKGLALQGNYITVPDEKAMELSGAVQFGSMQLVDLFLQLSPEQAGFQIPSFSDTLLTIDPRTLKQDLMSSTLMDAYGYGDIEGYNDYMAEEYDALQQLLQGEIELFTGGFALDAMKMREDLMPLLQAVWTDAAYEKPVKNGDGKDYVVHLDGAQVKATLISIMRYLYVDSQIADLYNKLYGTQLFDGKSFSEMMEENLLIPAEQELSDLPTDLTLSVNREGILTGISFVLTPPEEQVSSTQFQNLRYDITFDGNMNANIRMEMGMGDDNMGDMQMVLDVTETYADGALQIDMDMRVVDEATTVGLTMGMGTDKDGAFQMNFSMEPSFPTMQVPAFSMGASVNGTVSDADGAQAWSLPDMTFNYEMYGQKMSVTLALDSKTGAYTGSLPLRSGVNVFSLTPEELEAEMEKYEMGIYGLAGQLTGR